MTRVAALLFDKDGTLFDFAATWESWARAFLLRLCEGDVPAAAALGALIGYDLHQRRFARDSVVIAGTPDQIAAILHPHVPGLDLPSLLTILNEEARKAPQRQAVPLVPLLTDLRARGLKLGVATNDAEVPARAHLDAAGVTALFDFVAGSDSGYGGKPAPGQMLAFAGQVDVAPEACVMIGDSTHDLHAGRAAGMRCVGVLTGLAQAEDLAHLADVVLSDIAQLPDWLDSLDP